MNERDLKTNDSKDDGVDAAAEGLEQEMTREESDTKKLATELEDMRQTLVRHQADFANYRKRIERERSEDSKRSTARVIEALIPIVDGFEHALAAHREAEYENYRKGFELIYKQLLDNLTRLGAERMEPLGQQFDPHLHQAMDRTETKDQPEGNILEVFQPGYAFHGRVLRPAMVRVAVHPGGASNKAAN